ncbi:hypothetical protein [Aquicoccus porphyridii]|uniref:hypothetical protein n=1 Tax=Aquicoccus porphyridii TaxID=1852029 RepID=UPI001FE2CA60|nr:hypothetical protein [Aquicoccus porphyridii]
MLIVALAAYSLGTSGGASGVPVSPAVLMAGALFAAAIFVAVETRVSTPLVPMTVLMDRMTAAGFAHFISAQLAEEVLHALMDK